MKRGTEVLTSTTTNNTPKRASNGRATPAKVKANVVASPICIAKVVKFFENCTLPRTWRTIEEITSIINNTVEDSSLSSSSSSSSSLSFPALENEECPSFFVTAAQVNAVLSHKYPMIDSSFGESSSSSSSSALTPLPVLRVHKCIHKKWKTILYNTNGTFVTMDKPNTDFVLQIYNKFESQQEGRTNAFVSKLNRVFLTTLSPHKICSSIRDNTSIVLEGLSEISLNEPLAVMMSNEADKSNNKDKEIMMNAIVTSSIESTSGTTAADYYPNQNLENDEQPQKLLVKEEVDDDIYMPQETSRANQSQLFNWLIGETPCPDDYDDNNNNNGQGPHDAITPFSPIQLFGDTNGDSTCKRKLNIVPRILNLTDDKDESSFNDTLQSRIELLRNVLNDKEHGWKLVAAPDDNKDKSNQMHVLTNNYGNKTRLYTACDIDEIYRRSQYFFVALCTLQDKYTQLTTTTSSSSSDISWPDCCMEAIEIIRKDKECSNIDESLLWLMTSPSVTEVMDWFLEFCKLGQTFEIGVGEPKNIIEKCPKNTMEMEMITPLKSSNTGKFRLELLQQWMSQLGLGGRNRKDEEQQIHILHQMD